MNGRITKEITPIQCDGSSFPKGKKKPVILVRAVVTRKIPVQPSIRTPAMSPPTTTSPAAMATILMMVWTRVRVVMSMINYSSNGAFIRIAGPRKNDRQADLTQLGGLGLRGTATTAAQRARTRGFAAPVFTGCALWVVIDSN